MAQFLENCCFFYEISYIRGEFSFKEISAMRNIYFLPIMLSVILSSCTPIHEGAMRYDGIFLYDDGNLTNAHGYVFECGSEESVITFQIVSFGIDVVDVSRDSEYVTIISQPMVPPPHDEILENVVMPSEPLPTLDTYLQEITLKIDANTKSRRRESEIHLVSIKFNGFAADITIRQAGK